MKAAGVLWVSAALVVVVGCSTAGSDEATSESVADDSSPVTATTPGSSISKPVSTVERTLPPAPTGAAVSLDAVPRSVGMAECLMPLSELLDVDLAFTAAHLAVGERRLIEQTDLGVPVVYRALEFRGTQPIIVPEQVELATDAVLTTPEAAVFDADVFNARSFIDFDQLADLSNVLVLGSIDWVATRWFDSS